MENIQDLSCLRVENEPEKRLQRIKKRILRNFKLSSQRTQMELGLLVQDLLIYNRIQELQEIGEFVVRQGCIGSAYMSHVYAIYAYSKKEDPSGVEYYKTMEFLQLEGVPRHDDLLEECDKRLAEAKTERLGTIFMLAPLKMRIGLIARDIVHGGNSLFSVEFLEAKLQATLAEIRALLKIKL